MGWRRGVVIGSFLADSDGGDWRATTSLSGWEDAAPIRLDGADKSQQDGGWDSRGFYGARVISHGGEVQQPSRAAALAVLDELNALHPGSLVTYTVDDPNLGVRSALVRVQQGAAVEWVGPAGFRYTIQLRAHDPFKYGPATFAQTTLAASAGGAGIAYPLAYPLDYGVAPGTTAGAITMPNAGTASYHPRMRIDGGVTNPRITLAETGDTVVLNYTIPDGQWVDINAGKPREVLLNGQVSLRHLTTYSGNWCAVPVGGGSLSWTADAFTGSHSLSVWGFEGAWL